MKEVPVHKAVGMPLGHDLTRVIPGVFKGRAFKKGHIIRPDDIPLLLDMGKDNIYVLETPDLIHEDEAALRIARAAAGDGLAISEAVEGKVNLLAARPGLLKINIPALFEVNKIKQVVCATLHTNQWVPLNKIVAGTRIIPLFIDESTINQVEETGKRFYPLVSIKELIPMKIGMVTTGNEIYHERIRDGFGPVVTSKIENLGSRLHKQIIVADDQAMIVRAINTLLNESVDMILVTGGMSVDADDRTPAGVEAAGGRIMAYGAPVLPGSMLMLAYLGKVPVLGLPACVMHAPVTVFDLILPRLLAGERLERNDLISLGHGGLCPNCPECQFPQCSFGK